jgi:hypothetical protein
MGGAHLSNDQAVPSGAGDPSFGRILINGLRKLLRQSRKDLLSRQTGLLRQSRQDVRPDRLLQLLWSDLLVRAGANPGLGNIALAILSEAVDQLTQAAAQQTAGILSAQAAQQPAQAA